MSPDVESYCKQLATVIAATEKISQAAIGLMLVAKTMDQIPSEELQALSKRIVEKVLPVLLKASGEVGFIQYEEGVMREFSPEQFMPETGVKQ